MLNRYRCLVLVALFLLLTAYVSVIYKSPLLTNALAINNKAQSCEVAQIMNNAQGLDPDNISFLNWNIYKGNGDAWQQDLSVFAKSHNLMTIQEALLDDELTSMLTSNDFNWVMNTAFYLKGEAAGVMTVASFDAVHSCGFHVKEPLIRLPKSTLISYYAIDGTDEKLLVANIHSVNFTLGMQAYRQQLKKLFDAIEHHDGPMIVAGDFNSWSDDRVTEVQQLISRLSLIEIEHSVNNKTQVLGNEIDHVFYKKLDLVSEKVWQVSSSDHNPISVKFRLSTAM